MKPRSPLSGLFFVCYCLSLIFLVRHAENYFQAKLQAFSQLLNIPVIAQYFYQVLFIGIFLIFLFLPLGIIFTGVFPRSKLWVPRFLNGIILVPLILGFIVWAILGFSPNPDRIWSPPSPISVVCPFIGSVLGFWIGLNWSRGFRARLLLVPKLLFLISLLVFAGLWSLFQVTEQEQLEFLSPEVNTLEKQRIWHKIANARNKVERKNAGTEKEDPVGEVDDTVIQFTPHDLTVLFNWLLALYPVESKSLVLLEQGSSSTLVSIGLPNFRGHRRFLNLTSQFELSIDSGFLNFQLQRVRVGQVEFARPVCRFLSFLIRNFVGYDRRVKPIVDATHVFELSPNALMVAYRDDLVRERLAKLFGQTAPEELMIAIRLQLENMLQAAPTIRSLPEDGRALNALKIAFKFAYDRSKTNDPINENKAALIALNVAFGNLSVMRFVGEVAPRREIQQLRDLIGRMTIYGHSNWSENFFTAAAITSLSNQRVGEIISILKEELDQRPQADGHFFSFGDLLSRKSGIRLSEFALRGNIEARTLQDRILNSSGMEDFYPSPDGLPTDVVASVDFITKAGRTRGKTFDEHVKDIEGRINRCPGYQAP